MVAVEQLPADEDWRGRFVPVLGRLAAGEGVDTVEAEQSPPGWADAFLLYKDAPAAAFALRVVGDSMLPDYRDGDMVVVDPGRPVKSGVCCAIYEHDGERAVRLKRVRISRGKTHLESLNPEYKTIDVPAKKVHAYRIVARLPRVVERTVG